jgi:hypothetical protein
MEPPQPQPQPQPPPQPPPPPPLQALPAGAPAPTDSSAASPAGVARLCLAAAAACVALHTARQVAPQLLSATDLYALCAAVGGALLWALAPAALDHLGLTPRLQAWVLGACKRTRGRAQLLPRAATAKGAAAGQPGGAAGAAAPAAAAAAVPRRLCVGSRVRSGPLGALRLEGLLVADDGPRHRLPYLVEAASGQQRLCCAEDLEVLAHAAPGALAVGDAVLVLRSGAQGRVARVARAGPVAGAGERQHLVQLLAGPAAGGSAWEWRAAGELQLVAAPPPPGAP